MLIFSFFFFVFRQRAGRAAFWCVGLLFGLVVCIFGRSVGRSFGPTTTMTTPIDDGLNEWMSKWMNNANCKASSGSLLASTSLLFSHVHTLAPCSLFAGPTFIPIPIHLFVRWLSYSLSLSCQSLIRLFFDFLFRSGLIYSFYGRCSTKENRQRIYCGCVLLFLLLLFVRWINVSIAKFYRIQRTPDFSFHVILLQNTNKRTWSYPKITESYQLNSEEGGTLWFSAFVFFILFFFFWFSIITHAPQLYCKCVAMEIRINVNSTS